MSSGLVFLLLIAGKGFIPRTVLESLALALICSGLVLGVIALLGIRKHGSQKLLLPALIGMTANGLLLFIFVTNFLTARNKAINQNIILTGSPTGSTLTAVAPKPYQNTSFSFQFDGRYQLKESPKTSQVFLQHPFSDAVITDHREKLDAEAALKRIVTAVKADFAKQNYADVVQGGFEKTSVNGIPGWKIQLEYTRPVNLRVVAELCIVSTKKSSYSFMHYYPKNKNSIATGLFDSVLKSFAESENQATPIVRPATK